MDTSDHPGLLPGSFAASYPGLTAGGKPELFAPAALCASARQVLTLGRPCPQVLPELALRRPPALVTGARATLTRRGSGFLPDERPPEQIEAAMSE